MKKIYLLLYYGFARHLPKSTMPILGKWAMHLRYFCAKHLFAKCEGFVNVEKGAYFGNGNNFFIGNNVGIGKNFCSHNRVVTIKDGLLMGEDVLFQGGRIRLQIPICPLGQSPIQTVQLLWK